MGQFFSLTHGGPGGQEIWISLYIYIYVYIYICMVVILHQVDPSLQYTGSSPPESPEAEVWLHMDGHVRLLATLDRTDRTCWEAGVREGDMAVVVNTQTIKQKGSEMWPWVKIQIVPPVNIPIPTKKWCTYHPKWDPKTLCEGNQKGKSTRVCMLHLTWFSFAFNTSQVLSSCCFQPKPFDSCGFLGASKMNPRKRSLFVPTIA